MTQHPVDENDAADAALNLDALQALCDKATPGPWTVFVGEFDDGGRLPHYALMTFVVDTEDRKLAKVGMTPDAEFIAVARSAVPELIAEVARRKVLLAEFGSGPPKDSPNERDLGADDRLRADLAALADDLDTRARTETEHYTDMGDQRCGGLGWAFDSAAKRVRELLVAP